MQLCVSPRETGSIICNLLCTYAIFVPVQSEIIPSLFFCVVLIPISLYNLLLGPPERRNSSLFCFFPLQLLSRLEGLLKSEKCICVHINSVRFAYFFLRATMFILLICNKQHDQTENIATVHWMCRYIRYRKASEGLLLLLLVGKWRCT